LARCRKHNQTHYRFAKKFIDKLVGISFLSSLIKTTGKKGCLPPSRPYWLMRDHEEIVFGQSSLSFPFYLIISLELDFGWERRRRRKIKGQKYK
jgi:hypothetical protein